MRNFLRKLTRDEALADDLAQECFLHAWDKIQGYAGSGSFIGWLLRIAYTTFLQSKRKSRRYAEILEQAGNEPIHAVTSGPDTPANEMDVDTVLAALNEQERAIMIFSYACGLSHREISEATDLPAGTVKSIIHRAKEKIRTQFELENHQYG